MNFDIKSNDLEIYKKRPDGFLLELNNVSFSYLSKQNVLKNINLKIHKSDKIALLAKVVRVKQHYYLF